MRGFKASTLLTGGTRHGVACWVEAQGAGRAPGADCRPGPMLPESTLLLVPVLTRDWVEVAGGVDRLISTEFGDKLSPSGLVDLAGAGGEVVLGGGAISCWRPPPPGVMFCSPKCGW